MNRRFDIGWFVAVLAIAALAILAIVARDPIKEPQRYISNLSAITNQEQPSFEQMGRAASGRKAESQAKVKLQTATWPLEVQTETRLAHTFLYDAAYQRDTHAECEDHPARWQENRLRRLVDSLLGSTRQPSSFDYVRLQRYYTEAEERWNRDFSACMQAQPSRWTSTPRGG